MQRKRKCPLIVQDIDEAHEPTCIFILASSVTAVSKASFRWSTCEYDINMVIKSIFISYKLLQVFYKTFSMPKPLNGLQNMLSPRGFHRSFAENLKRVDPVVLNVSWKYRNMLRWGGGWVA